MAPVRFREVLFEVFTFLSVAAVAAYFASLEALTQFAEKKKEGLIEALCR